MSLFFAPRKSHASPLRRAKTKTLAVLEQLETRQLLSAIVHTDAADYAPSSVAVFTALNDTSTGQNFQAGETINFHIGRTDGIPIDSPPAVQDWSVVNGTEGTVSTNWNVDPQFAGASLSVTATGQVSGATATANFTDTIQNATVTKGSFVAPTADHASNGPSPSYTTIGDVTITEGGWASFQKSGTLTLDAPSGWQFRPGVGTIQADGGGDVAGSGNSITVTSSQVAVHLNITGTNNLDWLKIKSLQVEATTQSVPDSGSIRPDSSPALWMTGVTTATDFCDLSQVASSHPVASLNVTPSPSTPGQITTFDAGASYETGPGTASIVSYTWNFGDGTAPYTTFANANSVTHVYAEPGTFHTSVVVTDNNSPSKTDTAYQDLVVNQLPTWTSIDAGSGSHTYGDNITLTATVTNYELPQQGTVSFYDDGVLLGTSNVNGGIATFQTTAIDAGQHTICASYSGDAIYLGSHSSTEITIDKANAIIDAENYDQAYAAFGGATYDGIDWTVYVGAPIGVNDQGLDGLVVNNGGASSHTDAGTYNDTWVFTDTTGNYNDASGLLVDVIAKAPLSISATNSTKTYDGNTNVTDGATPIVTGLFGTDSVTNLTETFVSQNVGYNATQVGTGFAINDSNGGNDYYVASLNQGPGAITPATATIIITPYSGSYDGAFHDATGTVTGVNGEDLLTTDPNAVLNTGFSYKNAGTYTTQWNFRDDMYHPGNYAFATGQTSVTINKVDLTVVAMDQSKTYDGIGYSPNQSSVFVTGFVNAENLGNTSGDWGFTGNAVGAVNAGSYTITPTVGTLTATNYNFANFVSSTLTINKADATSSIQVLPYSVTYDGTGHTAMSIYSVRNLDLSGTTHTDAGTYTDTWLFRGGLNYKDTQGVVVDTIAKADVTIGVTPFNVTYDGHARNATATVTGVQGESLASLNRRIAHRCWHL